MQTSVTFKNLDPSENLKTHAKEKLDRLDKLLYNPAEANVVLQVEKFRHIAEVNISGDRLKIHGREETSDMYSAIDMVVDKIESQIKKSKQKNRNKRGAGKRKRGAGKKKGQVHGPDPFPDDETARIRVETIHYKPMDVDEAVMQMDLGTAAFLVFTNARTNQVNVLYRRKNDDYGLIQPN
ncbi:Ribosome hibernation promoting factor [Candidatus Desulfarcum epimagneticum]|uniref:Ribosome hibernation promoting factor n=1 Tax=uncultured Desulfobacteraceae bacterium TaxID=218296 RepID=A0A484HP67_9BACT|nr:Ribosome hibernation promoting factor [uncultured Desulfobacteraceae bacterium]